jgi:hypothetical protein
MRTRPIATLLLPVVGITPAALPFAHDEFAELAAREAVSPELLQFSGGGGGLGLSILLVFVLVALIFAVGGDD